MLNRKLMILTIFLLSLLAVSAVSAAGNASDGIADSAQDEIAADLEINNDNLISTTDETQLKDDSNTFKSLNDKINGNADPEIHLDKNYTYDGSQDKDFQGGININRSVTIYGNGYTIDGSNEARSFHVKDSTVTFRDMVFINSNQDGESYGGAIWAENSNVLAINCTFINNHANYGGAISGVAAINCTFMNNSAYKGGAVYMEDNSISGCIFINNSAYRGGAVYMLRSSISDCVFMNNYASTWGGAIFCGNKGSYVSCCTFANNSAKENGGAVLSNMWGETIIDSCIFKSDSDYNFNTFDYPPTLTAGNLTVASGEKLNFNLTTNRSKPILNGNITVEIYKNNTLFTTFNCISGNGWIVNLPPGLYDAVYKTEYKDFTPVNGTIMVKIGTKITANAVTTTYNKNKYLLITLEDVNGTPISGAKIVLKTNAAKNYVTDKNGQVKVNVAKLVPKTYTAKITFEGEGIYAKSSANVKVVVTKAKSKITTKKKTFKKAKKTKKYTITLKSGKKAIKKVKVTLKVKGKTYKAKTNSKGKATFKIKKLSKKKVYKAVIKFKGNKYYKKATKKVKITVK